MSLEIDLERILIVHNRYRFRGGEDSVVDSERDLLVSRGHHVKLYERDNKDINKPGLKTAVDTFWPVSVIRDIRGVIVSYKPSIIHVHNFFPQISPAVFLLASRFGIPSVFTLHNYRHGCAQGMFLRNGFVCEDCLSISKIIAVKRKCYRNSLIQTALLTYSYKFHELFGSISKKVTLFIALSEFSKKMHVACGLPEDKIRLKPNFVDLPTPPNDAIRKGGLFIGRLSHEKGIGILMKALECSKALPVRVIGEGLESSALASCSHVILEGWQESSYVYEAMRSASYLVMPSIWFENFPRTIVEAYACGLPVIASRLGAMAEIIKDGETGLLFEPSDAADLRSKIEWAESHPNEIRRMGAAARRTYEEKYTPAKNYSQLIEIYSEAQLMKNRISLEHT